MCGLYYVPCEDSCQKLFIIPFDSDELLGKTNQSNPSTHMLGLCNLESRCNFLVDFLKHGQIYSSHARQHMLEICPWSNTRPDTHNFVQIGPGTANVVDCLVVFVYSRKCQIFKIKLLECVSRYSVSEKIPYGILVEKCLRPWHMFKAVSWLV